MCLRVCVCVCAYGGGGSGLVRQRRRLTCARGWQLRLGEEGSPVRATKDDFIAAVVVCELLQAASGLGVLIQAAVGVPSYLFPGQVVFLDTPGLEHFAQLAIRQGAGAADSGRKEAGKETIEDATYRAVWQAMGKADVVMYVCR